MKVLLLTKKDDANCDEVEKFCKMIFSEVYCYKGVWEDPFPSEAFNQADYDITISYLGRWIVPVPILYRSYYAINFHPGPPEFPGYGPASFALYQNKGKFGVTCHHMAPKVDEGDIISTKEFPLYMKDNVESLVSRSHTYLLQMFYDIMEEFIFTKTFPISAATWSPKKYTKKELDALAQLTPEMTADEVRNRIRATTFKHWKPTLKFHNKEFVLC